jgi:hypothetical protein
MNGQRFRRLQEQYGDPLLTALTVMLAVLLFVVGPLQAAGVVAAHQFGIAFGLVLVAAVFILSGSAVALVAILVAVALIILSTVLRLTQPSIADIYIDATAWLIAGLTLSIVVARAVFAPGKVTFHRIIGAVLLYLNIGLIFVALTRPSWKRGRFTPESCRGCCRTARPLWAIKRHGSENDDLSR